MNREAERELDKADKCLAKGTEFYRKAAEHMLAAKQADPKLSNTKIAKRLQRSDKWVGTTLAWAAEGSTARSTPFAEVTRASSDRSAAKRVLADAPLEQVELVISELPFERQQAIAAATGNRYAKARQDADERERQMTPAQRKEREAAVDSVRTGTAAAIEPFDALAIATDLEHATELLTEMVADGVVTPAGMRRIDKALAAFLDEYRVAVAMVGQEAIA